MVNTNHHEQQECLIDDTGRVCEQDRIECLKGFFEGLPGDVQDSLEGCIEGNLANPLLVEVQMQLKAMFAIKPRSHLPYEITRGDFEHDAFKSSLKNS